MDERVQRMSQRTYKHNPWKLATVWGRPEGRSGEDWVEEGQGGKMETTVILYTVRIKLKKVSHGNIL